MTKTIFTSGINFWWAHQVGQYRHLKLHMCDDQNGTVLFDPVSRGGIILVAVLLRSWSTRSSTLTMAWERSLSELPLAVMQEKIAMALRWRVSGVTREDLCCSACWFCSCCLHVAFFQIGCRSVKSGNKTSVWVRVWCSCSSVTVVQVNNPADTCFLTSSATYGAIINIWFICLCYGSKSFVSKPTERSLQMKLPSFTRL